MNYERKVRATFEIELHLTDGQSNLRASATESRQPFIYIEKFFLLSPSPYFLWVDGQGERVR